MSKEIKCIKTGIFSQITVGKIYKVVKDILSEGKTYYEVENDSGHNDTYPSDYFKIIKGEILKTNQAKNKEADKRYRLWGDFQTIDLMKEILSKEEYIGFLKGNILKYKLRDKGSDEQDRIKAQDYQRELNELINE